MLTRLTSCSWTPGYTDYIDPTLFSSENGALAAGFSTKHTIGFEWTYDNTIQVPVPASVFNELDGNLRLITDQHLAEALNTDGSTYSPTGRFAHINTVQINPVDGTMTVRPINEVLQERGETELAKTRARAMGVQIPHDSLPNGKIIVPTDPKTDANIFDYSGHNNTIDLGDQSCIYLLPGIYQLPSIEPKNNQVTIPGGKTNE